jgi:glycosyltransferase involved in cell wall biosynthesis
MKFSVLIANYNNARYLPEAIESVLNQTYNDWEIIFVDDCSLDNSLETIKRFNDSRIKIFVNDKNYGCGYAKNRCVKESSGDICGFLDPDDTLQNTALEKTISLHKERPSSSIIYSTHYLCDNNLKILEIPNYMLQVSDNYLLKDNYTPGHFATFKSHLYFKTQGINPTLKRAVDQDLYYRMEERGDMYFINEPLYFYRIHEGGISTTLKNIRKAKYWHLLTMEDAYKRRKGTNLAVPYNIIRQRWNEYYKNMIKEAMNERNKKKYLSAVFSLIKYSPITDIVKNVRLLVNYNNV